MADITLTPTPALAGLSRRIGALQLQTVPELVLTSLAVPLGGDAAAEAALQTATGLGVPALGLSLAKGGARVIRLAPDQLMLATDTAPPAGLSGPFYTTDQTDAWVTLDLSGPTCAAALERLSMLDIVGFPVDGAQRTLIAHLAVILVRVAPDRWWLMSAASSAKSLAKAVEAALTAIA